MSFKDSFIEFYASNPNTNILMLRLILVVLFCTPINYIVQLIIHELGHLVFGLFYQYQFISIRFFGFTIVKLNGKFKIKKYKTSGSDGQCLMAPYHNTKRTPIYMTLGGVMLNLFTALLSMLVIFGVNECTFLDRFGIFLFSLNGFLVGLANFIPYKNIKGAIHNDGSNYFLIRRDKKAAECYVLQHKVAKLLYEGQTYKEFGNDIFIIPEGTKIDNELFGWNKVFESYYYMDLRQWDNAKSCLDCLDLNSNKLSTSLKDTIILEELFINIITDQDSVGTACLYNKIHKRLEKDKYDLNTIRVKMAYDIYHKNEASEEIRNEIEIIRKYYPCPGEMKFCFSFIEELLNKR